jgi:mono/diheme cytochrome c family protein
MKKTLTIAILGATLVAPAMASDVTYRVNIAPLVKAQCGECHGDNAPTLADFNLDPEKYKKEKLGPRTSTYADLLQLVGWPDTGALMRRLDDGASNAEKKPGNMYKHLGETDADRAANLKLVKAWVGEEAWNLNRWAKRGEVPAITKEQLDKLQIKY